MLLNSIRLETSLHLAWGKVFIFHVFLILFPDEDKVGTLDAILSTSYCRTQMYLSKQMAQLRTEITMPMFSGKLNKIVFFLIDSIRRLFELKRNGSIVGLALHIHLVYFHKIFIP